MNGANEAAVALFLQDRIGFYDIARLVRRATDAVDFAARPDLEALLAADAAARNVVLAEF